MHGLALCEAPNAPFAVALKRLRAVGAVPTPKSNAEELQKLENEASVHLCWFVAAVERQ